ncbi:MAG: hypothetical protein ABIA66_03960, partial [Candidatus Omnitrophota bacterium]
MNKKITCTLNIAFSLSILLSQISISVYPPSIIARRVLTPQTPSVITESWADFLTRIVQEVSGAEDVNIEPYIINQTFEALRHLRISPSEPAFRMLARHLSFQLYGKTPEEFQINSL